MNNETNNALPPPEAPSTEDASTSWWKRKWRPALPVWAWVIVCVLVVGAVGAAAGASSDKKKVDQLTSERDELSQQLSEAQSAKADLQSELDATVALADENAAARDDALTERDQALEDLQAAIDERDDALAAADQATADLDAILARFDPEIQAAIAEIIATADTTVCLAGDTAGFDGQSMPTLQGVLAPLLDTVPDAALPEGDLTQYLPMTALEQRLEDCFRAGELRGELEGPHGDGFFTVGIEIAAGKWRSDGQGDSCYWQISPDGNPDDIIDNHFGNAGGTVTLREGQEFETDDCGTWTKV